MSTSVDAGLPLGRSRAARPRAAAVRRLAARPELLVVMALAAMLDLWGLGRNVWANEFYSAAVRSMSTSWHDFLYASMDRAGVMTVDKPPLALWIDALSARVFGFHPLSVLVPQALMGVGAVALAYDLTRRMWGRPAGLVAGLVLATTPITVAVSRHNNPDALLVLCCTAALWCAVRAFGDGRTRWIVLAGVCVGLGFETKMAAALLVVPAIAFAWWWTAPRGRAAAVRALAAGGAAMAAVGGAWPLLVALTPPAARPWISGTGDNRIWSLIFGYNGVGRLGGHTGGPRGSSSAQALALTGSGPRGTSAVFGGSPGPLRLLDASLGGQVGWLLGAALVGVVGLAVSTRLKRSDPRTGWLHAVGYAFLTVAVAFSAASGIFHPYYTSQLAPLTALLVGATAGRSLASDRLGRLLGAAAVAGGIASELAVLHFRPGQLEWVRPALLVGGIAAAATLVLARAGRSRAVALAVAGAMLLAAPASWAFATLGYHASSTFPSGGPRSAGAIVHPNRGRYIRAALRYAAAHGGGTVALSSQFAASPEMVAGADVVGIGGFSGRESAVTPAWLAQAVRSGRIRWVLGDPTSVRSTGVRIVVRKATAAVERSCRSATTVSRRTLYDCAGRAGALARGWRGQADR